MFHDKVVDTSEVFRCDGRRRSLKEEAEIYLNLTIQEKGMSMGELKNVQCLVQMFVQT